MKKNKKLDAINYLKPNYLDIRLKFNQELIFFIDKDKEFKKDLLKIRDLFKIPKLNPREDWITKPDMFGDFDIEVSKWLESTSEKITGKKIKLITPKEEALYGEIILLLKKYNLPENFYKLVQWKIIYDEPIDSMANYKIINKEDALKESKINILNLPDKFYKYGEGLWARLYTEPQMLRSSLENDYFSILWPVFDFLHERKKLDKSVSLTTKEIKLIKTWIRRFSFPGIWSKKDKILRKERPADYAEYKKQLNLLKKVPKNKIRPFRTLDTAQETLRIGEEKIIEGDFANHDFNKEKLEDKKENLKYKDLAIELDTDEKYFGKENIFAQTLRKQKERLLKRGHKRLGKNRKK